MRSFVWQERDAFLHRLNPLTKLALALPVAILVTFFSEPVTPLAIAVLAAVVTWRLGGIPRSQVQRPLSLGLLLSVGVLWTGVTFYAGPGAEGPSLVPGPVRVTTAGLLYGITMVCRLPAIFAASLLFVLTTNPVEFVVALIQQARLPVRIGYAIFAAYRFMPLVHEELANIQAAHQVRGAATGGGPVARARQVFGYAIPLLAISVRRAERVALAMDSRGFGAAGRRTYYRTTRLMRSDLAFFVGALAVLAGILTLRRLAGL